MVMCFSNSACMYANISCMYSAYKLRELLYHTGVFLLNLMFLSMLTTCFSYRYLCTILELYAYSLIPSFFNHFTIHFCFLTCFRFCDQASACNSSIFGDCSSLCSWCIVHACRFLKFVLFWRVNFFQVFIQYQVWPCFHMLQMFLFGSLALEQFLQSYSSNFPFVQYTFRNSFLHWAGSR